MNAYLLIHRLNPRLLVAALLLVLVAGLVFLAVASQPATTELPRYFGPGDSDCPACRLSSLDAGTGNAGTILDNPGGQKFYEAFDSQGNPVELPDYVGPCSTPRCSGTKPN